ncbi:MAG: hypothetical protein DRO67_04515 [Candidatus Asgardarchaeum californiense]|nr:MAG: hypothetical protein DRO67_04515 [Candidatus Asgardarchaeum californiense]
MVILMDTLENKLGRISIKFAGAMTDRKEQLINSIVEQLDSFFRNVPELKSQKQIDDLKHRILDIFSRAFDDAIVSMLQYLSKSSETILQEVKKGRIPEPIEAYEYGAISNIDKSDKYDELRKELNEKKQLLKYLLTKHVLDYKILEAVEHNGRITTTALAKAFKLSKRKLSSILKRLEKEGAIHISKTKRPYVVSFINAPWR